MAADNDQARELVSEIRNLSVTFGGKFAVQDCSLVERASSEYLKVVIRLLQPKASGTLLETLFLNLADPLVANVARVRSVIEQPSILANGTPANGIMRGTRIDADKIQFAPTKAFPLPLTEAASPALTVRQRQVLQLISQGKSPAQIAEMLGISVRATASHRAALIKRLDGDSPAMALLTQSSVKTRD